MDRLVITARATLLVGLISACGCGGKSSPEAQQAAAQRSTPPALLESRGPLEAVACSAHVAAEVRPTSFQAADGAGSSLFAPPPKIVGRSFAAAPVQRPQLAGQAARLTLPTGEPVLGPPSLEPRKSAPVVEVVNELELLRLPPTATKSEVDVTTESVVRRKPVKLPKMPVEKPTSRIQRQTSGTWGSSEVELVMRLPEVSREPSQRAARPDERPELPQRELLSDDMVLRLPEPSQPAESGRSANGSSRQRLAEAAYASKPRASEAKMHPPKPTQHASRESLAAPAGPAFAAEQEVVEKPVPLPEVREEVEPSVETKPEAVAKIEVNRQPAVQLPKAEPPKHEPLVLANPEPEEVAPATLAPVEPELTVPHAVAERAAQHVRRGFALGEKKAYYSARSEFLMALRLISQSLDAKTGGNERSESLARGIRALEEVDDFVPSGSRMEADIDVAILASAHRTPIIREANAEETTPWEAREKYYAYASKQLAQAGAQERTASMALYGMGRIYTEAAEQELQPDREEHKAIAAYRSAMVIDSGNYLAANELGVLLAEYGHLRAASEVLQASIASVPQPAAWQNLAIVYKRLGDPIAAAQAVKQSQLCMMNKGSNASSNANVVWVDRQKFARTADSSGSLTPAKSTPPNAGGGSPPNTEDDGEEKPSSRFSWFGLNKKK